MTTRRRHPLLVTAVTAVMSCRCRQNQKDLDLNPMMTISSDAELSQPPRVSYAYVRDGSVATSNRSRSLPFDSQWLCRQAAQAQLPSG